MPGVSAVLNTLILVVMYVLITAAMQAYHGPSFLAKNPGDVFSPIAHDVMGNTWDKLVFLCIFTSGAASALTTLLPLTRQTLSMAAHKSLPKIFGRIHPKYMTPFWGTIILGSLSILWYVLLTWWNVNALYDAISAIGIMVCIAYGGTGLAATVYYRKELLKSAKNFFLMESRRRSERLCSLRSSSRCSGKTIPTKTATARATPASTASAACS